MLMNISPLQSCDEPDWLELRKALWSHRSTDEHIEEMNHLSSEPRRFGQFIARDDQGTALGFIEASVRSDYVNGTKSSPVGFLEGIYVKPESRREGVANALVQAAMLWARSNGCSEFASDTSLENQISQKMHRRLGFIETERVVYFKKLIETAV